MCTSLLQHMTILEMIFKICVEVSARSPHGRAYQSADSDDEEDDDDDEQKQGTADTAHELMPAKFMGHLLKACRARSEGFQWKAGIRDMVKNFAQDWHGFTCLLLPVPCCIL